MAYARYNPCAPCCAAQDYPCTSGWNCFLLNASGEDYFLQKDSTTLNWYSVGSSNVLWEWACGSPGDEPTLKYNYNNVIATMEYLGFNSSTMTWTYKDTSTVYFTYDTIITITKYNGVCKPSGFSCSCDTPMPPDTLYVAVTNILNCSCFNTTVNLQITRDSPFNWSRILYPCGRWAGIATGTCVAPWLNNPPNVFYDWILQVIFILPRPGVTVGGLTIFFYATLSQVGNVANSTGFRTFNESEIGTLLTCNPLFMDYEMDVFLSPGFSAAPCPPNGLTSGKTRIIITE